MIYTFFAFFLPLLKKGWGCNFTWIFGKVIHIKSLKMVFVAKIIRHKLCIINAFFDFFVKKIIFDKNYFLIAGINLTTWGPLYTCLVLTAISWNLTKKVLELFLFQLYQKGLFKRYVMQFLMFLNYLSP